MEKRHKTIYELELHETTVIKRFVPYFDSGEYRKDLFVTKVPGGWIYSDKEQLNIFVPYHKEEKKSNSNDDIEVDVTR